MVQVQYFRGLMSKAEDMVDNMLGVILGRYYKRVERNTSFIPFPNRSKELKFHCQIRSSCFLISDLGSGSHYQPLNNKRSIFIIL